MIHPKQKKAQTVSLDMLLGFFVFLIFIILTFKIWNVYTIRFQNNIDTQDKWNIALQISDLMVKQRGYPPSWELDPINTEVIGFAWNENNLSELKIQTFVGYSMVTEGYPTQQELDNYHTVKKLMNIERYNFWFRIIDFDKTVVDNLQSGIPYHEINSVTIRRLVLVDGKKSILEFSIY